MPHTVVHLQQPEVVLCWRRWLVRLEHTAVLLQLVPACLLCWAIRGLQLPVLLAVGPSPAGHARDTAEAEAVWQLVSLRVVQVAA